MHFRRFGTVVRWPTYSWQIRTNISTIFELRFRPHLHTWSGRRSRLVSSGFAPPWPMLRLTSMECEAWLQSAEIAALTLAGLPAAEHATGARRVPPRIDDEHLGSHPVAATAPPKPVNCCCCPSGRPLQNRSGPPYSRVLRPIDALSLPVSSFRSSSSPEPFP